MTQLKFPASLRKISLVALVGFAAALSWPELAIASAPDSDQSLRQLQFAASSKDLALLESRLNLDQTLENDCKSELDLKVLPKSCFRSLRERGSDVPPWLKSECVARAKTSKSRLELSEGLDAVPEVCQLAARERLADLHYLDASEKPSEIWTLERKVK